MATLIFGSITLADERRKHIYLHELEQKLHALAEDTVAREEFTRLFTLTARAALNTQQEEKIKMFARLFANYANGDMSSTADACEHQLAILEELSYLEIEVLLLLDSYEQTAYHDCPQPPRSSLYNGSFWVQFLDNIVDKIGIPLSEIPGLIERLQRTGLFEKIPGSSAHAFEHRGCWLTDDSGRLTPNFDTLKQWIRDNEVNPSECTP